VVDPASEVAEVFFFLSFFAFFSVEACLPSDFGVVVVVVVDVVDVLDVDAAPPDWSPQPALSRGQTAIAAMATSETNLRKHLIDGILFIKAGF
jgi:hypothetical protein